MSHVRQALTRALFSEQQRSPLPRAALKLSDDPLLALIDADTLSQQRLDQVVYQLMSLEPMTRCVVSANRRLTAHPSWEPHRSQIELIEVSSLPNAADQALAERADELIVSSEWSAALIFTQDRDLLDLAQRWRRARRPSFIVTLREDDAAKALIARSDRLGVSVLSSVSLRLISS